MRRVKIAVALMISLGALGGSGWTAGAASAKDDTKGARASIVGGKTASISSYPWLAFIGYDGPVEEFGCAGTVVAPRLVLTAGHCVLTETGKVAVASNFAVLTGTGDLREAAPERVSQVSQVLVFPGYEPAKSLNDAGLLVLAAPVTAPALPLASSADVALLASGTPLAIAGWGLTSFDPPRAPPILQEGQTTVQSAQFCQRKLRRVLSVYRPANQLCVRSQPGSGPGLCDGDSGGPGIARRADGSPVQVGVVSLKGALDCDPGAPQVLARADVVSPWVAAWTAAIEHGAPAPPVTVPDVELPPVTRRDAEIIAWFGLIADFGNRFSRGESHRIGCARIDREKVKCVVEWLRGVHLYRGGITVYTALPREGTIYNYRYKIRRFNVSCWINHPRPIQACNPRLFRR